MAVLEDKYSLRRETIPLVRRCLSLNGSLERPTTVRGIIFAPVSLSSNCQQEATTQRDGVSRTLGVLSKGAKSLGKFVTAFIIGATRLAIGDVLFSS